MKIHQRSVYLSACSDNSASIAKRINVSKSGHGFITHTTKKISQAPGEHKVDPVKAMDIPGSYFFV